MNNKKEDFDRVLFVSPEYRGQKGGMASVLEVYAGAINHFHFLPSYKGKGMFYNLCFFLFSLIRYCWLLIFNRNIRIIHIHCASRGSFMRKAIYLMLGKLLGKKTILHIHGGEFKIFYNNAPKLQGFIKYILRKADVLIVLSSQWQVYFDELVGYPKSVIVNNPINLPASQPVVQRSFPLKMLYLNRIYQAKGIYDLMEVFMENRTVLEGKINLLIAGDGENEIVRQYIDRNQLGEIINFVGWVSGNQKDALIQESDFFALTSYNEGLPMSILEAMAFGKPILATEVGGIPQIVHPDENGWLLNPGDKNAIMQVLLQIINKPELIDKYGVKSFEIAQEYSVNKVMEKLSGLYNTLN